MLSRLIQFCLQFRGVVIALACLLVGYGSQVALRTKLDVFPEFASPQVVVQTEAPGLSAEEIEQLVTRPIEFSLNGTPELEAIRSQSIQGLSAITLVFNVKVDIYRMRQMITERLGQVAGTLPQGVKAPKLGPLTSSTSLMLVVGLTSTQRTSMELRTFADWTMRTRLLGVPGVAKVEVFGGEVRQIQVQVIPERLRAYGIALDEVVNAARQATGIRGAGFVDNVNQRIVLRTEGQSFRTEQMENVVVTQRGAFSLRLKDVARVVDGAEPKFGDAQINGNRGVVLQIFSQYGANTLEVTAAVEQAIENLKPALNAENIKLESRLFRPANFIENTIHNISQSLLLGGAMVMMVLFFFLLDWRTAFISCTAIPLSLLAAVIILDRAGIGMNTLTLGGFAIAIGVVVDDAIIDVENVLRRLRENRELAVPRGAFRVIHDATIEVRNPIIYATYIIALVLFPILLMSGVQGALFRPLAQAFILAIVASLAVAVTLTPALCYVLLARVKPHVEPVYIRWLKQAHGWCLRRVAGHPRTAVLIVLLLFAGSVATLPFFGGEFLPEFREGHFILHMVALPGTSLDESIRSGQLVSRELLKNPHIKSISQQAGRAENGEDTWGTHYSELHVELNPMTGEESEGVVKELRTGLARFPGLTFRILPFLSERIEETISGATAQVVISVYGDDMEMLDDQAGEVRAVLAAIPGAADVQVEAQPGSPQFNVRLRPDRLIQFGFKPVEVLEAIQTAYQGTDVAQTYEGNRVVDVTVILDSSSRQEPEAVGSLLLRNSQGLLVPLRELVEMEQMTGRFLVAHEGARRRQQVTCNVTGRDIVSFVAEAKRQIGEQIHLSPGTYLEFTGSAEEQAKAKRELLMHSLLAGVGILILLALIFNNGRNLLLVLANLPFAMFGGILAAYLAGRFGDEGVASLSLGSLVGFIALFGITMRNSILMVSHYEHLVQEQGCAWNLETSIRGASERLLPILMTALVTALGLLPLALGSGEAGREIEGPMAVVILGGLASSTLLNLLLLPTIALYGGKFEKVTTENNL